MAKEAYYFSHDANARTDPKILQMRSVYKSEGYGWYWMFIEKMREEADYTLSMQGKYVWNAFALEMDATAERIKTFVEDCICEFKLFESDGTKFWSNSLLDRMKIKEIKSEKARQSADARWKRKKETEENQGSERSECDSNANASKNDAIKESKVKEIKEKKNTIIIPYDDIFKFYVDQGIVKHKALTAEMKKAIDKAHKAHSTDEIITAVKRYGIMYRDKVNAYAAEFCKYQWTLTEFMTREKGIADFLDEGGKWIRYTAPQGKPKGKSSNFNNFEQRPIDHAAVEELEKKSLEGTEDAEDIDIQAQLKSLRGK